MAWSKNINTYPAQLQELWVRVVETGLESIHKFDTNAKAKKFQKTIMAIRYAHTCASDGPYREKSATYCAELTDPLTVRICSIDQTERAQLASLALSQRREQDKARGVNMLEFAPLAAQPEPSK